MAMHNAVNKAMFQQEFRPLKTGRQVLAYGFFHHPRSSKTYESIGLGNVKVSEHGK